MEEREKPTVMRGPGESDAAGDTADIVAPPKYDLQRCLGRGGFGIVFLARDRVLQRDVALKFLTHALPADLERFRREARITARLNDPAIVKVYEFGEVERRPYLAMQYIDGGNLLQADLEPEPLVRTMREVALALGHAHEQGIVHRDIKPQNILLDRERRAYVADFGVARDLTREGGATMTAEGGIVGTPALMPPEQARGHSRAIDARSDVYSLGASLFAQLTGRMPFVARDLVDLLHAVVYEAPPLPRSFNPAIPRALEGIVLKCLQKNRDDRFATMAELVQEFDRFLSGTAVASCGGAWFRKLVGAPMTRPPDSEPADPHLPAVLEISREIAAWDANLYRISTNITRTYAELDDIVARLDIVLAARPDHAPARFTRGEALFRRGRLSEALEAMEPAIDRVNDRARAQFELGRLYLAIYLRQHRDARKHLSRVGTEQDLAAARGRLHQAVVAFSEAQRLRDKLLPWQLDYARAVERLAEGDCGASVETCDAILARDPDIEEVWKLRGDALRFCGLDAVESYDRAISVRRSFYEALHAKAEALIAAGRLPEAREALVRALTVRPDFADGMALLARACWLESEQGGPATLRDEALEWLEKALVADPRHYDAATTKAELLIGLVRFDEALAFLERAKGMTGCQNRVGLLTARARLGRVRSTLAGGGDARAELEAILGLARQESTQVPDNEAWAAVMQEARALRGGLKY